jgi:heme-degrading monooxygenase HmoA
MIARTWRGWASPKTADDYVQHYQSEVAGHLRQVPGFLGARLLRRTDEDDVLFTSITFFTDLGAVRSFAGPDYEQAVVEPAAQSALTRWEPRVAHHEVVADLSPD